MTQKHLFLAFVVLLLCSVAVFGQAKPNFTGEWTINAQKSSFGDFPAPDSYTAKIEHNEPNIKVVTTQVGQMGEMTTERDCATDTGACTVKAQFGDIKSTAKWDGPTLVTDSTMDFNGMAMKGQEKMSLSDDGKTLTLDNTFSSDMGQMQFKIVLDKK